MSSVTGNSEKITRSRSRSKAKRRKEDIIQLFKMLVVITLIGLFIWSLFYMIIGNNLHKDRRNTELKNSTNYYQNI
jgi:hypothetical protein